jgi:hypothetical protein
LPSIKYLNKILIMRILEIPDAYGPNVAQFSPGFDSGELPRALFFTGWEANPCLTAKVQNAFDIQGIGTLSLSVFDTIDPLEKREQWLTEMAKPREIDVVGESLDTELPFRMIHRAVRLSNILKILYEEVPQIKLESNNDRYPEIAITHCAGANITLLCRQFEIASRGRSHLPDSMLLVEPMIAEGVTMRGITRRTLDFDRRANPKPRKQIVPGSSVEIMVTPEPDLTLIPLQSLLHPDFPELGSDRQHPLTDILDSRGITYLIAAIKNGLDAEIIVGQNDIAAPADVLSNAFTGILPVLHYPEQTRTGHGFMLAHPEQSAPFIAQRVSALLDNLAR